MKIMAKLHFIQGLRRWLRDRRNHRFAGFTLIELLVSLLIGAIITGALLSLVVDLTENNQRDTARSETQRDMQLAMNYITQELREAVYVYDGDCLQGAGTITDAQQFATSCPGIVNHIPTTLSTGTSTPVLAFWRVDPLPEPLRQQCENAARASQTQLNTLINNGIPCVSGRSYTLVVYAFVDDTSTTDIWQGKGRIVRYQLSQFDSNGNPNPGWFDPLPDPGSSFQQWPYQLVGGTPALPTGYTRPTGNADVLVDFVDDAPAQDACPAPSVRTPRITPVPSFYACVRGNTRLAQVGDAAAGIAPDPNDLGVNQEVLVVITGNAAGRAGIPVNTVGDNNVSTRLAPLQTRVLTRGILNKNPR